MRDAGPVRPRRREAGFSLLEVLIAAALLGLIAVGVLPLFTQSMANNRVGNDATRVSTYATDRTEDLAQVRFLGQEVSWNAGTNILEAPWEMLTVGAHEWAPLNPSDNFQFRRRNTVSQMQLSFDGQLTGVPGNAPVGHVHLKEVTAEVATTPLPADPATDPTVYRTRYLKGY
ncbi:MAG TPA: prepilin-type N-terminal cleavage/methylation domain-containing protein [Thermoanaerobaculia bacterium]|nr:prepilin-type N-terminal cleavage/methylation domain-containing protein [Thermoanaerobaculia bacterium]